MLDEVKNKRKPANVAGINELVNSDADNFLADTKAEIPSVELPEDFGKGEIVPHSLDNNFIENLFAEAEGKETKSLKEVTAQYLKLDEFKMGEERTFIHTGITTFTTDQGEVKDAVVLMDKNRCNFIVGSVVVVNACKRLSKIPCAIRLQVNGKIKGTNGSYFDVKVFEF